MFHAAVVGTARAGEPSDVGGVFTFAASHESWSAELSLFKDGRRFALGDDGDAGTWNWSPGQRALVLMSSSPEVVPEVLLPAASGLSWLNANLRLDIPPATPTLPRWLSVQNSIEALQ